jgi:hypothetical protein
MTTRTYNYISEQMLRVCPLPVESNGTIRLQLTSEHGKTNYLNLTPYQFRIVEQVLLGEIKE